MTSSSSPLIAGESEGCLSGSESDEAYGSGHISSVSDVKTVRSGKLVSWIFIGLEKEESSLFNSLQPVVRLFMSIVVKLYFST